MDIARMLDVGIITALLYARSMRLTENVYGILNRTTVISKDAGTTSRMKLAQMQLTSSTVYGMEITAIAMKKDAGIIRMRRIALALLDVLGVILEAADIATNHHVPTTIQPMYVQTQATT